MSFVTPQFNLNADIYTGPWLTKVFRFQTTANLAFSKRVTQVQSGFDPVSSVATLTNVMSLLLPMGTDVRDHFNGGSYDVVECPSGSGRWYAIAGVDDIGKGFANEHRCAWLVKIGSSLNSVEFAGLTWPTPIT